MIRLLHLSSVERDFQTRRYMEFLTHDLNDDFAVINRKIGAGGDWQNVPAAIRRLRRKNTKRFDAIHAWGMPALFTAVLAGYRNVIYSPQRPPTKMALRWIKRLAIRANATLVFDSSDQQGLYIDAGISSAQARVIRSGVDLGRVRADRNINLRRELGFAPEHVVILAPGESTRLTAHRDAVWGVGILNALDDRYRLLIWGRGDDAEYCERFARKLQGPGLLTNAEKTLRRRVRFEELTSLADAAMVTARGIIPPLPTAICMAAELPIVAPPAGGLCEILEDRESALIAERNTPRHLAQGVFDLWRDHDLRLYISRNARAQARERFALTRFLDEYQSLYFQAAGLAQAPARTMT